jgi:ketosteroid isomerase-like protein
MKTRWVISLIVLGAFILLPQAALAGEVEDLEELKVTHMNYMGAVNTGNVEAIMGFWVEGGVSFMGGRAFPIVVNITRAKKFWSRILQTHRLILIPYKPDFRVIGNTGLVWGHFTQVVINKEKGVGKRRFQKFSYTYIKSEGKWKIALAHSTQITGEQEIF